MDKHLELFARHAGHADSQSCSLGHAGLRWCCCDSAIFRKTAWKFARPVSLPSAIRLRTQGWTRIEWVEIIKQRKAKYYLLNAAELQLQQNRKVESPGGTYRRNLGHEERRT